MVEHISMDRVTFVWVRLVKLLGMPTVQNLTLRALRLCQNRYPNAAIRYSEDMIEFLTDSPDCNDQFVSEFVKCFLDLLGQIVGKDIAGKITGDWSTYFSDSD